MSLCKAVKLPDSADIPLEASGADVNLLCGSFLRFHISETETEGNFNCRVETNGCSVMRLAGTRVAEALDGRSTTEFGFVDLEGLLVGEEPPDLRSTNDRSGCMQVVLQALRICLEDLRSKRSAEYNGEEPLLCTCFGITEGVIRSAIETGSVRTVAEVTGLTRAGAGCGACRLLIAELLDHRS